MPTTRNGMELFLQLFISRSFNYFHLIFKRSKNRKRLPHIIVSSFESIIFSSSKRNFQTLCHSRSHFLKTLQQNMSSSSSSSQESGSSSPSMAEVRANAEGMHVEALRVTPLRA